MEFTSDTARSHYDALIGVAAGTIVGLDFDGTLAPVVDDPDAARIHPGAAAALLDLAPLVRAIAVVTGRPVRQAIALGDLDEVGAAMGRAGTELLVLGQYGHERWTAGDGRVVSPKPPRGLVEFERELPDLLRSEGFADAHVEEKGLAVAVHTRRLTDPVGAFESLLEPMRELARRHDLSVEPGRNVIEVRSGSTDKGDAVRVLAEQQRAEGFLFAGDDLGDLAAFDALRTMRADGMPVVLVCSASAEQSALADRADIVVDGPDGVLALLAGLASDIGAR